MRFAGARLNRPSGRPIDRLADWPAGGGGLADVTHRRNTIAEQHGELVAKLSPAPAAGRTLRDPAGGLLVVSFPIRARIGSSPLVPVSYTHLTLPTTSRV